MAEAAASKYHKPCSQHTVRGREEQTDRILTGTTKITSIYHSTAAGTVIVFFWARIVWISRLPSILLFLLYTNFYECSIKKFWR
jgi:hypothetical protein